MSKEQIEEMANKPSHEKQRRGEYVRRIVEAVRYKGTDDHEDVWSILCDYRDEIIAGYRKQSEGEWIKDQESKFEHRYHCSVCNFYLIGEPTKHCEDCGAKIKGGAE